MTKTMSHCVFTMSKCKIKIWWGNNSYIREWKRQMSHWVLLCDHLLVRVICHFHVKGAHFPPGARNLPLKHGTFFINYPLHQILKLQQPDLLTARRNNFRILTKTVKNVYISFIYIYMLIITKAFYYCKYGKIMKCRYCLCTKHRPKCKYL